MSEDIDAAETLAAKRYFLLNAVRIGSLGAVILGIAAARNIVDLPYWLGVILAFAGLVTFYFGPRFLARRWKRGAQEAQP